MLLVGGVSEYLHEPLLEPVENISAVKNTLQFGQTLPLQTKLEVCFVFLVKLLSQKISFK